MKSTTPSRSARRTSKKRAGRFWGEVLTAPPPDSKDKGFLHTTNGIMGSLRLCKIGIFEGLTHLLHLT